MSRSNYDKPFYVDVGTSIVAVRCASNHDVVLEYDHVRMPYAIELAENACARMNKEAEIHNSGESGDYLTQTNTTQKLKDTTKMNANEITATFQVAIPTINHHIALAESNVGSGRPALVYVHFEIENDRVHIVTTNGRVLPHTEVQSGDGLEKEPITFDVRAMPKITAKKAATTTKSLALFVVKDGLISSGDIVARIAVDVGFPKWRKILPGRACLERETAWRPLNPKHYALAQKFAGRDNYAAAHRVQGQTDSPVVFYNTLANEDELNTAVVMPMREV